jgi:hypothetical protein
VNWRRVRAREMLWTSILGRQFWIIDGTSVGWSTGNMSPTDFSPPKNPGAGGAPASYPVFGAAAWAKTNRDFSVFAQTSSEGIAEQFRDLMAADSSDASGAFDWSPGADVRCG